MTTVKITKRMLKLHPADLLVRIGAVDEEQKQGYPSQVYFSREDYKELSKNLKNSARKMAPNTPSKLLTYSVNVDLLNYGPNESLADAIRPGYALIDYDGMK